MIFPENFESQLLKQLLQKINLEKINEIKNMKFSAKRSSNNEMMMKLNRNVCDVMSSYFNNK